MGLWRAQPGGQGRRRGGAPGRHGHSAFRGALQAGHHMVRPVPPRAPHCLTAHKSLATGRLVIEYSWGNEESLVPVLETETPSVSLRFHIMSERNLALYYCADRQEGRMHFGNTTQLVFVDRNHSVDGVGLPPCPPQRPRGRETCLFHLAFISVLCLVFATGCLFFIIRKVWGP